MILEEAIIDVEGNKTVKYTDDKRREIYGDCYNCVSDPNREQELSGITCNNPKKKDNDTDKKCKLYKARKLLLGAATKPKK